MHQPAQLQCDIAPVFEEVVLLGPQRAGCVDRRGQEGLDHDGDGGNRCGAGDLRQGHAQRSTLAGHQRPTETGAGQ